MNSTRMNRPHEPMSRPLLDTDRAARYLAVQKKTMCNWRTRGDGPPFLRIGRSVRYSPADLDAWLDARRFHSTSEADVRGLP